MTTNGYLRRNGRRSSDPRAPQYDGELRLDGTLYHVIGFDREQSAGDFSFVALQVRRADRPAADRKSEDAA